MKGIKSYISLFQYIAFVFLLISSSLRGEEIMGGAVSYTPPIPMLGEEQAGNAGLPISGWEYRTEGGKTGYAQVNFQIMSISAIFPKPSEPGVEIRTISDLRKYLETTFKARTDLTNASTRFIKLGGHDAVACRYEKTTGPGPCRWFQNTFFILDNNRQWLRSSLFHVSVSAEKEDTYEVLLKSLDTVKVRPREK